MVNKTKIEIIKAILNDEVISEYAKKDYIKLVVFTDVEEEKPSLTIPKSSVFVGNPL